MRKLFFISLLLICLFKCALAQNADSASVLYKNGLAAFSNEKYELADSLFNCALKLDKNPNTYYNLAMTKYKLSDYTGYCFYLCKAAYMHDGEAYKQYWKSCGKRDTLYKINGEISRDTLHFDTKEIISHAEGEIVEYKKFNSKKELLLAYREINNDTIYEGGSEMKLAEFQGGEDKLFRFLADNIEYPNKEKNLGYSGTVYLSFSVDTLGRINSIHLAQSSKREGLDLEAIRVVLLMPNWIPAEYKGRKVKMRFNLPIKFVLK